jgi:hypothetical protein
LTIRYINLSFNYFGNFYRIIVFKIVNLFSYLGLWCDLGIKKIAFVGDLLWRGCKYR